MENIQSRMTTGRGRRVTTRASHQHPKQRYMRLILPGMIVVGVLTQIPFLGTLYLSFFRWNLLRPSQGIKFIGFSNFARELSSMQFYHATLNTVVITLFTLVICLGIGMLLALLLNQPFWGRGIVRSLIITPFFVMSTVSGIIWKDIIFDPSFGLFAWAMRHIGMHPVAVAQSDPMILIILVLSWRWIPFFMLILLAGLQSFPEELHESGQLDGANGIQRFFSLVIPHLMRYMEVAIFLGLIFILQTFGTIYVTTQGGPGLASTNLSYLVYRTQVQNYHYGLASSVSVLFVVLTVVGLSFLFKNIRNRFGETLR
ncbi:carbohydrate ABC transporter permease [Alicyclobacillus sp. SO9]|uniref:carbohydrate ABC transporter permease n=1 Tax=Alicyclobacillus sp. SO9 TaxID=2665646 RepID=UPI0018E71091|nr:sugar ABC transporter permease [Alicyclobacillus sp. SO9]